ncbi:MAG TPA: SPFH domain-containing protein [Clostridia bacterium]|nr:SPFH domain-containing protein [Clostridia bacterium]HOR89137.1 SPFH domain-containing protein [Clostridia bacterium]HPL07577.1 SPFH domain-containing protein [Clostridia bacterium]
MGLIRAVVGAAGGVLADQWREFFYCESMDADVLVKKGQKRTGRRGVNVKGEDNIISNGSIVAVNEGQFMMIVDQGQVVDFSGEPGEFIYDTSTSPSMLYGNFGEGLLNSFKEVGKRFTMGADPGKDQRVYFFNMKEIVGNKYGTPNAVPFRVIDKNIGLDIDIAIRCHGEYSYKIVDPVLFYTNVTGNVVDEYKREVIDGQLKTELMTALQPAFAKISEMGIRYSALPGHTMELADALNQVLSEKWTQTRGIAIGTFGISSLKASEEDEELIKKLQRSAVMRDPTMAAATLVGAQSEAMVHAAQNEGAGPVMAFAGMNLAGQAGGMNASNLYAMGGNQQGPNAPDPNSWTCSCGTVNKGKFCGECGKPKPVEQAGWTCECGTVNKGKFCGECGKPKPAGAKTYKCDKCGWDLPAGATPPKFCPECGDAFNDADEVK